MQWLVYGFLFGFVHPWLFDRLLSRMIHEVSVERTAFFARATLYLVFGVLVATSTTIFDYAKVRAVVEDRRSMMGAIGAALGFIRRQWAAAAVLFLLNFALFAMVVGVYGVVAPGAGRSGITMWIGFTIGQAYILGRAVGEAGVLGVGDGAVPEPARSRGLRRTAGADLAGFACRRRHLVAGRTLG